MCFIGRDGCLNHFSCYRMFKRGLGLTPSHIGCHTASSLLLLLDLDPQTTPKEMDETDALFVCKICPIEKVRRIWGRKVLTWRECVRIPVLLSYMDLTALLILGCTCS